MNMATRIPALDRQVHALDLATGEIRTYKNSKEYQIKWYGGLNGGAESKVFRGAPHMVGGVWAWKSGHEPCPEDITALREFYHRFILSGLMTPGESVVKK